MPVERSDVAVVVKGQGMTSKKDVAGPATLADLCSEAEAVTRLSSMWSGPAVVEASDPRTMVEESVLAVPVVVQALVGLKALALVVVVEVS